MILLTKDQKKIIDKAINWFINYTPDDPVFSILSYAGCGKTTIANFIPKYLGLMPYNVIYTAFTGKACSVLIRKGNNANTIHRTFYQIRKMKGSFYFKLKKSLPYFIQLIIIDEASMVGSKMMQDIISFNIPVICLADPGQIGPVAAKENPFINTKKFPVLKKVIRQKENSGILSIATMIRNGKIPNIGQYNESKVISFLDIENINIKDYDMVLCYRNNLRKSINYQIRSELGYLDQFPEKGEKVICLRNNYHYNLMKDNINYYMVNGLVCFVQSYTRIRDDNTLIMKVKPEFFKEDDKNFFPIVYSEPFITGRYPMYDLEEDNRIVLFDFAYAVTITKSQGSSWDNVLVINDYIGSMNNWKRVLYTGVTRAAKSVTLAL